MIALLLLSFAALPFTANSAPLYRILDKAQQMPSIRALQNFFHESDLFEPDQYIREVLSSQSMSMDYVSMASRLPASMILDMKGGASQAGTPLQNITNVLPNEESSLFSGSKTMELTGREHDAKKMNSARFAVTMSGVVVLAAVALFVSAWRSRIYRTRLRRSHFYSDPLFFNRSPNQLEGNEINIMMDREDVVVIV